MKLNQLRDFIAVARAGSIHQAARELNLSQPALTKSIRQLEKDLNTPLFERTAKGAVLNELGASFLVRAELAANELSRGRDELIHLAGGRGGRVAVAVSGTPSLLFLSGALKSFRRRFPTAQVRIIEGILPVMLPELREGNIDFAMAPKPVKPLGKEFSVTPICPSKRVVVGRRGHPLENARSLVDLQNAEWVLTGAAGPRAEELEEVFRNKGLSAPIADVQCESLIALVCLLATSDLLALLPEPWTESPITSNLLIRFPVCEEISAPEICLIRREALPLTHLADIFADAFLREAAHTLAMPTEFIAGRR